MYTFNGKTILAILICNFYLIIASQYYNINYYSNIIIINKWCIVFINVFLISCYLFTNVFT